MKKRLKELRKGKRWSRYFLRIFGLLFALFCLLLLVGSVKKIQEDMKEIKVRAGGLNHSER